MFIDFQRRPKKPRECRKKHIGRGRDSLGKQTWIDVSVLRSRSLSQPNLLLVSLYTTLWKRTLVDLLPSSHFPMEM